MTPPPQPENDEQPESEPVGSGEVVVGERECIESISFQHGLLWKSVWEDPANAELRSARRDPNVLRPGDRLHVRPIEKKQIEAATEQTHRFRVLGIPAHIAIRLLDEEGKARSGLACELTVDEVVYKLTTNGEGEIRQKVLPTAVRGVLRVGEGDDEVYELDLRHLDPVETERGQKQRLLNLGYLLGEVDEKDDESGLVTSAIRSFQDDFHLEVTGVMNKKTQDALRTAHGC